MRIIGGAAAGRRLASPKGDRVRPTPDRVKEALFNILGPVEGLTVLDLFAGTGNVGLEALSRGAVRALFVEKDPKTADGIRRALGVLGLQERGRVWSLEAKRALVALKSSAERFDFIFIDPPYERGHIRDVADVMSDGSLLSPGGCIVYQHALREPVPEAAASSGALQLVRVRRYGETMLTILEHRCDEP